jgi:non-canonical purine NTP pyrophosphatase (RdgB/HAM1 family)
VIDPIFITGNDHKASQLSKWLGIELRHQKVTVDEIQSLDLKEVVKHKARQAYDIVKQPVIVEDVGMVFTAFKRLPGPFIKWFETGSDLETMCRMLDSFEDRSATAFTLYCLYDGHELHTFSGNMHGTIPKMPRGSGGFGFDSIFVNDGQDLTRAEMDEATYSSTSYRQAALAELRTFLQNT